MIISEIHGFITTIDDVVLVAPIIKEYMDVAVKNDEKNEAWEEAPG